MHGAVYGGIRAELGRCSVGSFQNPCARGWRVSGSSADGEKQSNIGNVTKVELLMFLDGGKRTGSDSLLFLLEQSQKTVI